MRATRRGLLAGAATLTAARGALAAIPPQPNSDAELLRLGALFEAAWAVGNAAYAAAEGTADEGPESIHAYAMDARTSEIVGQIEALPARTFAGVLVKVRALFWCRTGEPFEAMEFEHYLSKGPPVTENRLLADLLTDLAAMGEGV